MEKIGRWSDISEKKSPFRTRQSKLLERMLSINVAVCAVILVGRVIRG